MSRYINITTKMAVLSLMLAFVSCSDEVKVPNDQLADENAISFSILPESAKVTSRAAQDPHISDGSQVNTLRYVIYKKNAQGEFEIDPYYNDVAKKVPYSKSDSFTLKLIPDPTATENDVYKIFCWAQYEDANGVNDYYDVTGFPEKISVKYTKPGNGEPFANNDELRDVFYAAREFTPQQKGTVVEVTLIRPLAQINIGTSGWDYEGIASIQPNAQVIKFSKIKIKGVANTLDMVNNRAWYEKENANSENELEVEYAYSVIPSYRHIYGTDAFGKITGIRADDEKAGLYSAHEEEFLKVKLTRPGKPGDDTTGEDSDDSKAGDANKFADYIGWKDYDYYCATSGSHDMLLYQIFTETFKYMSMSYVLVPFETKTDNQTTRSTVEVTFDCAEADESGNVKPEGVFGEYKSVIELKNVPAYRNHRTNIIAADGTGFFMNSNEINVAIYSETFADYYKRLAANDDDWTESDLNGDSGSDVNDNYEWPDDDKETATVITPNSIRMVIQNMGYIRPYITDTYHSDTDNVIHAFDFTDDKKDKDITFRIDGFFHSDNNPDNPASEKHISYAFDEELYLNDELLDPKYYQRSNGGFIVTLPVSVLSDIIQTNDISREEPDSDNPLDIWYYPINFSVTLTAQNEKLFKVPEDFAFNTQVRVYPVETIYTFNKDSDDEGADLIRAIKQQGTWANTYANAKEDEKMHYHLIGANVYVETANLKVKPRENSSNNNDYLYEMGDHIYMRGASNNLGHWLFLKGVTGNYKITAKISRDKDEDNSKNNKGEIFNRALHINFGGNPASQDYTTVNLANKVDDWNGYAITDPNVRFAIAGDTNSKTVYNYYESKIMKSSPATNMTSATDIQFYVNGSSHGYYWVILSVPEN